MLNRPTSFGYITIDPLLVGTTTLSLEVSPGLYLVNGRRTIHCGGGEVSLFLTLCPSLYAARWETEKKIQVNNQKYLKLFI